MVFQIPDFQTLVFFAFAAVLVFAALRVITSRNPVYAVLHLILAFFTCGAIWALLQAEFLAIAIILVYVGAVMVLFLFVVMMLDIDIDLTKCIFCGFCEEACPVDAIVETRVFEYHGEKRGDLYYTKEMLLANGDRYEAQIAADRELDAKYR